MNDGKRGHEEIKKEKEIFESSLLEAVGWLCTP